MAATVNPAAKRAQPFAAKGGPVAKKPEALAISPKSLGLKAAAKAGPALAAKKGSAPAAGGGSVAKKPASAQNLPKGRGLGPATVNDPAAAGNPMAPNNPAAADNPMAADNPAAKSLAAKSPAAKSPAAKRGQAPAAGGRPAEKSPAAPKKPVPGLEFLDRLDATCKNPGLFRLALTHRSSSARLWEDNQRLEFLGDAVLGLYVSELFYGQEPPHSEGRMSRLRAAVVNEKSLAALARSLGLGGRLMLGAGEEASGGRDKDSILADALEAVVGACYLSEGSRAARALVRRLWGPMINRLDVMDAHFEDYKTRLQEVTQSLGLGVPRYELVKQSGPDNERVFTMGVSVPGLPASRARGRTKKAAGQLAAKALLAELAQEQAKKGK
jgi:ribonuclease-3